MNKLRLDDFDNFDNLSQLEEMAVQALLVEMVNVKKAEIFENVVLMAIGDIVFNN